MNTKIFIFLLITAVDLFSIQIPIEAFSEDLNQLTNLIIDKHVSPFWKISEEEFKSIVDKSSQNISKKSRNDHERYVELFKVIASIRDGHSGISGNSRYELFGYLPFSVDWFDNELRVTKVAQKYSLMLGGKIVGINDHGIESVLEKLRSVVPHANNSRFKKFSGYYLHLPGLLYGLGITDSPEKATFKVMSGNTKFEIDLFNMPPSEEKTAVFLNYSETMDNLPLHLQNRDSYYWYNYDNESKIFYFQYNRVGNMEKERSSAFASRMWDYVDSVEVEKFILDLRFNGGGSFPYSLPFIQGILDRPEINKRGKLFILTGYETFSAAILMLNILEAKSEAIIIGEPPCDHPASPGDSESYELKNTKLKINLSTLFHPTVFPNDKRNQIILDQNIILSWKYFVDGVDPIFDYVSDFTEGPVEIEKSEAYKDLIGRYEFSPTRHLLIHNNDSGLQLEISHSLSTPLYSTNSDKFKTEIIGLSLKFKNGDLYIYFPDGSNRVLKKISSNQLSAIECLYQNKIEEAKKLFIDIKTENPDYIELKDHQFSFLASVVYFDLLKHPTIPANDVAKNILKLGIELNDGNAPFCEFSLRFYN